MPAQYPGNAITKAARAKVGGGFESAIEAPGGDLQLVAESGFAVTGDVADLAEVTISGQDFGTKPPVRHFDRIDRYWDNGTEVVDPYATRTEGDSVPNQSQVADSPFPASGTNTDFNAWLLRQEAARRGRDFGYQLESGPSGRLHGTTNAGFAGWPVAQRDSEELYMRFWHYQKYFSSESDEGYTSVDMQLASSLTTGATSAQVVDGWGSMSPSLNNALLEFYITLDDGSLHYCQQVEPEIDEQNFNFTPSLPSPASAGNKVYIRNDFTMKMMRVKDAGPDPSDANQSNCYAFSGFKVDISNDKYSREPGYTDGRYAPGQWNLYEIYLRAPKLEVNAQADFKKIVRINGTLRLNINGISETSGGVSGTTGQRTLNPNYGWPSSGLAVANFGFEEDRDHAVPNNSARYSDIYIDGQSSGLGARKRVEIGIGNDDLYQCLNRECCPIKTWNNSITVNLNALPFTEAELTQARLFVVDADDTATLVARVQ